MGTSNKNYHTIDQELKKLTGHKVVKISIDAGFSCPNRDGTLSDLGCIFCSEKGSGDFSTDGSLQQIKNQIAALSVKWPNAKYLAYLQSYSNTYCSLDTMKTLYSSLLNTGLFIGIVIATRPDCLDEEKMDYIQALSEQYLVWIELGLQTIHERTGIFINRGYSLSDFEKIYWQLKERHIKVVIHLIAYLPFETHEDFFASIRYMNTLLPWGIKIHLLHVLKHTRLEEVYHMTPFDLPTAETYIQLLVDALEMLDDRITIHRITGDAPKDLLIAPWWSLNKRLVLNGVDQEFRKRGSYQGKSIGQGPSC